MVNNALEALKMIQSIITRLANNSFLLKGWTVTIVIATLLLNNNSILLNNDSSTIIKYISILPIIMFWLLDSYYLSQERLFRKLHKYITENTDLSFNESFNFNANRFKVKSDYFKAIISGVELGFYFPILVLTLIIIIITIMC